MHYSDNKFPWGVFAGELHERGHTLPLFLPAQNGGFTLFFDNESEAEASRFIENIALYLTSVLPQGLVKSVVFDFGYKKRFPDLASLKAAHLYDIALDPEEAQRHFAQLEKVSLYRHHELLSPEVATISDYNRLHEENPEPYCLLLLNLNNFSDNIISPEKINAFFASAFEVGFFTVAFGTQTLAENQTETVKMLTKRFPPLQFVHNKLHFGKAYPVLQKVTELHPFQHLNTDSATLRDTLLHRAEAAQKKRLQEVH